MEKPLVSKSRDSEGSTPSSATIDSLVNSKSGRKDSEGVFTLLRTIFNRSKKKNLHRCEYSLDCPFCGVRECYGISNKLKFDFDEFCWVKKKYAYVPAVDQTFCDGGFFKKCAGTGNHFHCVCKNCGETWEMEVPVKRRKV